MSILGKSIKPVQTGALSETLLLAFEKTFARTEQIFDLITEEAYWLRPISLRHPINFYEGHLCAFAWNTLFRRTLKRPSFNPAFDRLFERGIDPKDQNMADQVSIHQWPHRDEVREYKRCIQDALFEFLASDDPFQKTEHPLLNQGHVLWLLLEHEWMHQETFLYMLHQLPHEFKKRPLHLPNGLVHQTKSPQATQVDIPAGTAILGALDNEFRFAWDNELPPQTVDVGAFSIDILNVTNGQFLEFIEAGGYHNPDYWTPETWQWKTEQAKEHPFFWKRQEDTWLLRDFFEDIPLPLSWPVSVTHAEAQAFARFKNQDLPTEAEWHRAAFGDSQAPYPWGAEIPSSWHGNFDFQHWSPVAVGQFPKGASPFGVQDLTGNGWEWTSTQFAPFPGFTPSEAYPQYSADFFDGQHYVVKGASCFTDAGLLRRSFRNWYYWHYPYMYATFRCIKRRCVKRQ